MKLLQKDFAKHPDTIVCFDGELPDMEIGALGDNMILYNRKYSHTVAEGYDMKKALTYGSLYSIVDAEIYNDTNLHLTIYADLAEWEIASAVTKISYADGTYSVYITPVNHYGFKLIRYQNDKKIVDARSYIWDISNVRPLSYNSTIN